MFFAIDEASCSRGFAQAAQVVKIILQYGCEGRSLVVASAQKK